MKWSHKYGSERACERVHVSVCMSVVYTCVLFHTCGCGVHAFVGVYVCACVCTWACVTSAFLCMCTRVYVCVNVCGQALWALPLKLSSLFLTDPHMLSRYVCGAPPRRMGGAYSPTAVAPPLSTACGTEQRDEGLVTRPVLWGRGRNRPVSSTRGLERS